MRIKLKHMEVEIRRRETAGVGSSGHHETETIAKYEIMDGAPVRLESIPIRCVLMRGVLAGPWVVVHDAGAGAAAVEPVHRERCRQEAL